MNNELTKLILNHKSLWVPGESKRIEYYYKMKINYTDFVVFFTYRDGEVEVTNHNIDTVNALLPINSNVCSFKLQGVK